MHGASQSCYAYHQEYYYTNQPSTITSQREAEALVKSICPFQPGQGVVDPRVRTCAAQLSWVNYTCLYTRITVELGKLDCRTRQRD
jgi:hypothetical protein